LLIIAIAPSSVHATGTNSNTLANYKDDLEWLSRRFQELRKELGAELKRDKVAPLDLQLIGDLSGAASRDLDHSVAVYTLLDLYTFAKDPRDRAYIGKKLKDSCAYYKEGLERDLSIAAYAKAKAERPQIKTLAVRLSDKLTETRSLLERIAAIVPSP
jgi:hypothetical protein